MSAFEVLMPDPLPAMVIKGLEQGCTLHKLWEARRPRCGTKRACTPHPRPCDRRRPHADDGAFLARLPKLEIVASYGVGYDHVDAKWAGAHNIVVTNTPDVLNEEVADTAHGLCCCARCGRFPQADRYLREGKWLQKPFPLTATLRDRTLGIVGLGRIGKAIAKRAETFGLKIVYHGRRPQADAGYDYFAFARRHGARRRYPARHHARRAGDQAPHQCRSAGGARPERRADQRGARLGRRRGGADRRVARAQDHERRPRRLRRRAARAASTDRHGACGPVAACRARPRFTPATRWGNSSSTISCPMPPDVDR